MGQVIKADDYIYIQDTPDLVIASDDKSDCSQVIRDCNIALKKADAVIQEQQNMIHTLDGALGSCLEANKSLELSFREAEEGRQAWYRQPEIVIPGAVTIGIILGLYLAK